MAGMPEAMMIAIKEVDGRGSIVDQGVDDTRTAVDAASVEIMGRAQQVTGQAAEGQTEYDDVIENCGVKFDSVTAEMNVSGIVVAHKFAMMENDLSQWLVMSPQATLDDFCVRGIGHSGGHVP